MSTLNQSLKNISIKKRKGKRKRALQGSPQRKSICLRVFTRPPKKPNSALRKLVKVRCPETKTTVIASIPGEGHNLQEHSVVLIKGGRVKDLPGVKYRVIRGVLDMQPVVNRCQARSKYGTKKKKKRI